MSRRQMIYAEARACIEATVMRQRDPAPLALELHRVEASPSLSDDPYTFRDKLEIRVMAVARDANIAHLTFPA